MRRYTIPPTEAIEVVRPFFNQQLETFKAVVTVVEAPEGASRITLISEHGIEMASDRTYYVTPEIEAELKVWMDDYERMQGGAEYELSKILVKAGRVKPVVCEGDAPEGMVKATPVDEAPEPPNGSTTPPGGSTRGTAAPLIRYRHHPLSPDALYEAVGSMLGWLPYPTHERLINRAWKYVLVPYMGFWIRYACPRGYHGTSYAPQEAPHGERQSVLGFCRCGIQTVSDRQFRNYVQHRALKLV